MLRVAIALACALILSACATSITQNVRPVSVMPASEICIIRNASVRPEFLAAVERNIQQRGYSVRALEAGSSPRQCPTTLAYQANWTWDLAMYLSYARLDVYQNGVLAGEAEYNARNGGLNGNKFVSADEKIAELIAALFQ